MNNARRSGEVYNTHGQDGLKPYNKIVGSWKDANYEELPPDAKELVDDMRDAEKFQGGLPQVRDALRASGDPTNAVYAEYFDVGLRVAPLIAKAMGSR